MDIRDKSPKDLRLDQEKLEASLRLSAATGSPDIDHLRLLMRCLVERNLRVLATANDAISIHRAQGKLTLLDDLKETIFGRSDRTGA